MNFGFTLRYTDPLWFVNPSDAYSAIREELSGWEHEVTADGGYKDARFTFRDSMSGLDDWFEKGLGRHIEGYSPSGEQIWEGFVNQVSISSGTLTITRGPLLNVVNRVFVVYTPIIDVTVDPPVMGVVSETPIAEDVDSQALYGILEASINGGEQMDSATVTGGAAANDPIEMRDGYLKDNKDPETTKTVTLGNVQIPQVTLECQGYKALLNKYIYSTNATGTTTIPVKLAAVLAAQPNGIFSSDTSEIANTAEYLLLAPVGETQNRTAAVIIDEMVAKGDRNDVRTIFGFGNGRKAYYHKIPNEVAYIHRLTDTGQEILIYNSGAPIEPWEVKPGQWMFIPDFLMGRQEANELRLDPRNIFIESVRYSAPRGLTVNGAKVGTIKQLFAKKGVAV